MNGFKDLKVWEDSKNLAVEIYLLTNKGQLTKDYGLRDQLRRSAVSIPSNIAEGDERGTNKESIRFFYIAKGSLAELRTQLEIAFEVGYFSRDSYEDLDKKCYELGNKIGGLIKSRKIYL